MNLPTLVSNLSSATNTANSNYTDPATALQILGQQPIPGYVRQLRTSPNGVTITNGTNVVAFNIQDIMMLAVTYGDIGLSYAPYISVQPANSSVTHPAAASFSVTAISELAATYNWQVSTNGGSTWGNASGGVYSGNTTATLAISNSTGLTGYLYRCQVTNTLGTTTSNQATLTVA